MISINSCSVLNHTADSAVLAARSSYEKFQEMLKRDLESDTPKTSSLVEKETLALEGVKRLIDKRRSKQKRAAGLKVLDKKP